MNNPLVSICLITYNHSDYIRCAIEGVLNQKMNFPWEFIIADDFSTDGTREIIMEYKKKHPENIKLIFQEQNVGPGKNWLDLINKPLGKYIAYFEGDDYWIDNEKLIKQIEFLECNDDYGMTCTNYHKLFEESGKIQKDFFKFYKSDIPFEKFILDRSSIATSTVLMRNNLVKQYFQEIPDSIRNSWNVGDIPLWLFFMINSKVKFQNFTSSVYRIRNNSACHFSDIKSHYDFVMKGFEIPEYFIKKYNFSTEYLPRILSRKDKATMKFAFKTLNYKLALKTYRAGNLKNKDRRVSFFYLIGSVSRLSNRIIRQLFKLK